MAGTLRVKERHQVLTQAFLEQEGWEDVGPLHFCKVLLSCFSLGVSRSDALSRCASEAQNHDLPHMGSRDRTEGGGHPCCGGTTGSYCQIISRTQEQDSAALRHPLSLKAKESSITFAPCIKDSKAFFSNLNSSQQDGLVISECAQVDEKFADDLILLPLVDQPNYQHRFPPKFRLYYLAFPLQLVLQLHGLWSFSRQQEFHENERALSDLHGRLKVLRMGTSGFCNSPPQDMPWCGTDQCRESSICYSDLGHKIWGQSHPPCIGGFWCGHHISVFFFQPEALAVLLPSHNCPQVSV